MSNHIESILLVTMCLMGMVSNTDANHAIYTAGMGACGGAFIISGFPSTKKLSTRARINRGAINAVCGMCVGPLAGVILTDYFPTWPLTHVMLFAGCIVGVAGVAVAMLFWAALKRILPTALKTFLNSFLTNALSALNSSKPNASPETKPDGNRD